jgi:Ca2+-binding RTX toxin-like protein
MKRHGKHHGPTAPVFDDTGPSSSQTPYLVPTHVGVQFVSILSTGDQADIKDGPPGSEGQPWRMVGIPDGLGAFDNGDGTMTVLMNHELGATSGAVREHGSTGAFVSRLVVDLDTLEVVSAGDLSQDVFLFDRDANTYVETTTQFGRLCSADLPAVSAFYDASTGLGTTERIFMDGEEIGNEGRAFAHVVTGPEAGDSYELPALGRFSWENSVANAYTGAKTVVMGLDDSSPVGEVYLYVGDKRATGTAVERAGLTDGDLYGIAASFGDDGAVAPTQGTFQLVLQGDDGDVTHTTGTQLQAQSAPLTQFGRPEDGAWDPSNPSRFYFVTTGAGATPMRLWALDFTDIEHPELGGTITMLVEGGLAGSNPADLPVMFDNMTVTESGLVIIQEDPGNNPRLARVWMYNPATDNGVDALSGLTQIARHDPARFTNPAGPTGTPAPGSLTGFGQDEESSGVVDMTNPLGNGERLAFLLDTQAHYAFSPSEFVEGGQLMAMFVDLPNPGNSRFNGTSGSDTYDGGFGDDRIDGGRGDDVLWGNYGDDRVDGGNGNDSIDGGPGEDRLNGGGGNDTVAGGTGDDDLRGEDGDDSLDGGVGDDRLEGGDGSDTLMGNVGDDNLKGGGDDDSLHGGQGVDRLSGGDGNDDLHGGSAADELDGGKGDDMLNGGAGGDDLTGGRGADTFFIASPEEGGDTIFDFQPGDDLITLDLDVTASEVAFVGFEDGVDTVPASGPALIYSDASGLLSWDPTGGSASDEVLVATLIGSPGLERAEVLLV